MKHPFALLDFALFSLFPFLAWIPFSPWVRDAKRGANTVNDFMTNIVKERRGGAVNRNDIMQMMVEGG